MHTLNSHSCLCPIMLCCGCACSCPRATVTFVREMPPDRCSHYACVCLHVLFFFVCVCLWSLPCCLLDWKNNNQQQIWKHAVSSMHLHLTAQAHTCTTSQISSRASVPVFRLMSVAAYDKKKIWLSVCEIDKIANWTGASLLNFIPLSSDLKTTQLSFFTIMKLSFWKATIVGT